MELFIIGINHLLGEGRINEVIEATNRLWDSIGWGMQKESRRTI
jgi:hypothetical protein